MSRRRTCAALTAGMLLLPAEVAVAHGVQGRADTPIPVSAFFWAAAAVMVVSFAGLSSGWSHQRLTRVPWRPLPARVDAVLRAPALLAVLRAATILVLLLVWAAAAFGSLRIGDNIAPVAVFVVWWIGLVPVTLLFGDVWRALNPWAALARLCWVPERTGRPIPDGVGLWPAVLLIVAWGWLELVYPTPGDPRLIGGCIFAYTALTLAGMARYGVEPWLDRGEAFSVYTRLLATMSIWETRRAPDGEARLGIRPPLVGVTRLAGQPAQVAFLCVVIATVTFDGLSGSELWARRDVAAAERLIGVGIDPFWAGIVVATIGLLVSIAVIAAAYEAAAAASSRLGRLRTAARTASEFAYTLLPIALAYAVAHYFTLFVFQSQDLIRLASDPFGTGANWFGTADHRIDFRLMSPNVIWAVQVAAIVVGHVASLALAHDRAVGLAPTHRLAVRSQLPLLLLMVGLTVAGLWSLSEGMASV